MSHVTRLQLQYHQPGKNFKLFFKLLCQLFSAPCYSLVNYTDLDFDVKLKNHLFAKVLKALQDAVTNHNLVAQQNSQVPEPTPSNVNARSNFRQLPIHSFQVSQSRPKVYPSDVFTICELLRSFFYSQVKMVRSGRQTVSVNVEAGVLLFDKKAGSFGTERLSHDRSMATQSLGMAMLMS